ncbi:hypothetical protein LTR37_016532 [Vermiconidia calcicola]|uniref:Uncharacterized protein n=1 Tax=Vermiconidia calcicola TaxID=1690605 RepID=A0ACC3MMK3_9PEZI|nr:hypothetical protein LTR37_016532 [Vermiconidia calcicola]
MPRRQFMADLKKAQTDVLPHAIHDLQQGEDDGQIEFLFSTEDLTDSVNAVKVTALIPDLGDYPKSHEYMIFSGEEAPRHIAEALQNVRRTGGKTVYELLDIVSATLSRLSPDKDGDSQMPDSQFEDDGQPEDEDDDDVYDSDHEAFQVGNAQTTSYAQPSQGAKMRPADRAFRARIRSDLVAAKAAGFKVGVLGHILDGFNAFVTISSRIAKLGISEEAMEAWQLKATDYLILILQYPNGYKTNEELQGFDSIRLAPNIGLRVCAGKKYKPTVQEAIKAFTTVKNDRGSISGSDLPKPEDNIEESSIKDTFISKPLNGLLQERLVTILRFRSAGMSWKGAEEHCNGQASAGADHSDAVPDMCFQPESANPTWPGIVNADHYRDTRGGVSHSFPLLAMQFLLRHFVRCTEFCLVCHRKMDTELEAIKPYVCESELCLYQYMTLGFGPSIEHEILAQPYVVDLLVSFCYNSAAARKLKEFPDGLSLAVPPADTAAYNATDPYGGGYGYNYRHNQQTPQEEKRAARELVPVFEVGFDRERLEIIFFEKSDACPVRRGDWIVMQMSGQLEAGEYHCRVAETTFYPTISINEPVVLRQPTQTQPPQGYNEKVEPKAIRLVSPATTPKWLNATFQVYCEDFKILSKAEKCMSICRLLDTLPDVKALQEYLVKRHPADLKNWTDCISPAALSLLRWIIASNRACIMQVDGDTDGSSTMSKQERLYGMKNYMQFRFAMGAPDKEQRFLTEVRKTTDRLALAHPTLFAWHGSPLYNWHMIIREGLHFKNTDHGRAYGHGVYHALDAQTSTGYSGMHHNAGNTRAQGTWSQSVLRISSALALNEVVNAPAEFVSSNPFYVVAQLDWIQTRYLFVQCAPSLETIQIGTDTKPNNALAQDPKRIPRGVSDSIVIPASAIKTSRTVKDERKADPPKNPGPLKRLKALGGFASNPIKIDDDDDDDAGSIATDAADDEVVFGTDPEPEPEPVETIVPVKFRGPTTDFVPGTLDFSKLHLMPLPTYATSNTTKRLMKELQTCAKVQDSTPLAELGWYVDIEKIENAYQWIVELHSFHIFEIKGKKLPLADDMKKKGAKSVVMEIRFNKDFPFTPPYVRVIRPRFLGFNQGGGGHIVLGGAMCMELLTNTGWSSVSSMESVLMQIRMAIASEPFARLDMRSAEQDYGTGEAADGYIRACQTHGWQVPPGFKEMAYGIGGHSNGY